MSSPKFTYFNSYSHFEIGRIVIRFIQISLILMVVFLIIHFFDILALIGKNLAASDKAQPVETLFVLGGNSYERGVAAAEYLHNYPTPVVCTGGNYPVQIQALGFHLSEGELTKECLVRNGINSNEIQTWGKATSSFEESEEILLYAQTHGLKKIAVLSSEYHLRRLRFVFEKKFKNTQIEVIFLAAKNENFTPESWYTNEEGLITTFNEYAKMVYYLFKYS